MNVSDNCRKIASLSKKFHEFLGTCANFWQHSPKFYEVSRCQSSSPLRNQTNLGKLFDLLRFWALPSTFPKKSWNFAEVRIISHRFGEFQRKLWAPYRNSENFSIPQNYKALFRIWRTVHSFPEHFGNLSGSTWILKKNQVFENFSEVREIPQKIGWRSFQRASKKLLRHRGSFVNYWEVLQIS